MRNLLAALIGILIWRAAAGQDRPDNWPGVIQRGPHGPPAYQASLSPRGGSPGDYQQPPRQAIHAPPRLGYSASCEQSRRMQYASEYYTLKSMHANYQAANFKSRPTTEQLTVQAKRYAPERIEPAQIQSQSFQWPRVLLDQVFDGERANIEQAVILDDHSELRRWIANMDERLIDRVRFIDIDDYAQAKKFLLGLKHAL